MNNKPQYFRWVVLLCDDATENAETAIKNTKRNLENAGLEVLHLQKAEHFLDSTNTLILMDCHLVLMDMQWRNLAAVPKERFPSLPEPRIGNQLQPSEVSSFIKRWLEAVRAWSSAAEKPSANRNRWPRYPIGENEIGAWLGAMISHTAPKAQIIFFSGKDEIFSKGLEAALGRFKNATYEVHTKPNQGVSETLLWPYLIPLQKECLRCDPNIKAWFLNYVLIPMLSKESLKPAEARVFIPSKADFEQRLLSFDRFFPNLARLAKSSRIKQLAAYIERPLWADPVKIAFKGMEHALDKKRFSNVPDWPVNKVREALSFAHHAGVWGTGIAGCLLQSLSAAAKKNWSQALEHVNEARFEIHATLNDLRPLLQTLVLKYGGHIIQSSGKRPKGASIAAQSDKLEMHLFPPHWLETLLFHLCDNAKKAKARYGFMVSEEADTLVMLWTAQWRGLTEKEFWDALKHSLHTKGESRGLPLVVRFGIESGAEAFDLYAESAWKRLWPPIGTRPKRSKPKYNYALRWEFKK